MNRDEGGFFDDEFFDDDEYLDDELDDFEPGPVPHPDDRLWRHPSEMAALAAGGAGAVPASSTAEPTDGSRPTMLRWARPLVATTAAAVLIAVGVTRLNGVGSAQADNLASGDTIQADTSSDSGTQRIAFENTRGDAKGTQWSDHLGKRLAAQTPIVIAISPDGTTKRCGVFLDKEGHVATSAGDLAHAESVVVIHNDIAADARIVGIDTVADVAVLATDQPVGYSHVLMTNSLPHIGDAVVVSDPTSGGEAAVGHVAQTNRRLETSASLTFFDAFHVDLGASEAATPGLPVFDDTGSVVGMIAASFASGAENPGTVVAIPARTVDSVARSIIENGAAEWPWIGTELVAADSERGTTHQSVQVGSVAPDSPADQAGITMGDRIITINDQPAASLEMVGRTIQSSNIGDRLEITVERMGEVHDLNITLGSKAQDTAGNDSPQAHDHREPTPIPTP